MPVLLLLLNGMVKGQDIIYKRNGDTLRGKVLTVSSSEIQYRRNDSMLVNVPRWDIRSITYENGTADTFADHEAMMYRGNYYASMRLDDMGREDAHRYYTRYKGAKNGTLAATLYPYPILGGVICAAIISSTPPKEHNLGCPYPELMSKPEYGYAYRDEAFRIKRRAAWRGFGIGAGIMGGILAVVVASTVLIYSH